MEDIVYRMEMMVVTTTVPRVPFWNRDASKKGIDML